MTYISETPVFVCTSKIDRILEKLGTYEFIKTLDDEIVTDAEFVPQERAIKLKISKKKLGVCYLTEKFIFKLKAIGEGA